MFLILSLCSRKESPKQVLKYHLNIHDSQNQMMDSFEYQISIKYHPSSNIMKHPWIQRPKIKRWHLLHVWGRVSHRSAIVCWCQALKGLHTFKVLQRGYLPEITMVTVSNPMTRPWWKGCHENDLNQNKKQKNKEKYACSKGKSSRN